MSTQLTAQSRGKGIISKVEAPTQATGFGHPERCDVLESLPGELLFITCVSGVPGEVWPI
jgi:hypothetical protein